MPDFPVDGPTRLDRFLSRHGVQAWRQQILVDNAGVRVYRGGSVVNLGGLRDRLETEDVVRVVDPPPPAAASALQAAADSRARDYAFAPGATAYDLLMAELLDLRPRTIRINEPLVDSLASFVAALSRNTAVSEPVRDLVIASHAHPEGMLQIKMHLGAVNQVTFQDLEAAVASRSLVIDPALLEPRPHDSAGTALPARVLIRGCRIGTAPAYLRKLKEAFGNALPVIAPKHFHIVAKHTQPAGRVEYMAYGFAITRPEKLSSRQAVIEAFQEAEPKRIDGSTVPPTSWDVWLPGNPHRLGEQNMGAKVILPTTKKTFEIPGRYRFKLRDLYEQEQSFALASDPGSEAGRKAALQAELEKTAPYQASHPFPEYVRLGYRTMAEFMAGWQWQFRYDNSTKTMYFTASRAEYTVIRPIVEPATNRLILNFYPVKRKVPVIEQLDPADPLFFATV